MSNLKRQTATQQNQQETQRKKLQLVQDTLLLIQQKCKADRTQKQTNIKFVIIGEYYDCKKGQPDRNKTTTHER